MRPRFDWYQATIRTDALAVLDALRSEYPGCRVEPVAPRLGYSEGYALVDALGRRATVQQGGRNLWPNVTGSGQDAPAVSDWLRGCFPDHEVTRFDSCVDYDGEGAWDRTVAALFEVAERHPKVAVEQRGDWRPGKGEKGLTVYLGSAKSAVRIRAYEKGKERKAAGDSSWSLGLVRLEVLVRPKDGQRVASARVRPEEGFGFSRFAADAWRTVTGFDVQERHVRDYRASNDRRALEFMARQYQPALDRLASRMGSWAALSALIESEVAAARAARRRPGGAEGA